MKKNSQLLIEANQFWLTSLAGVKEDMAKRIMYSILPSLADKTQMHYTQGIVDYKALASAISGRHDIIKYGTRACVRELVHFTPKKYYTQAQEYLLSDNYDAAIKIAKQCFESPEWAYGYGGEAWLKISNCLGKLIFYDQELKKLQQTQPKDLNKEIQISQMIIVELNIFDGLSHNTASIMRNVIAEEYYDHHPRSSFEDSKEDDEDNEYNNIENEINKTFKLMDAKELSSPIDVYMQIEKTLTDSGDIHKYKDYTHKLRNLSRSRDPLIREKELLLIRLRKVVLPARQSIIQAADLMKRPISINDPYYYSLTESKVDGIMYYQVFNKLDKYVLQDCGKDLSYNTGSFLDTLITSIHKLISQYGTITSLSQATDSKMLDVAYDSNEYEKLFETKKRMIEEKSKIINTLMHYLDSI